MTLLPIVESRLGRVLAAGIAGAVAWAIPASAQDNSSGADKSAILQGFLSRAAQLSAADIHAQLTGVMGLISEEREAVVLDFSLGGQNATLSENVLVRDDAEASIGETESSSGSKSSGGSSDTGHKKNRQSDLGPSDSAMSFADPANAYIPPATSDAGPFSGLRRLLGFRRPEEREAVYDLETARFALAQQLGDQAPRDLMKPLRFNFWLASKGEEAGNGYDPTGTDAGTWALSTGVHYKVTPTTMVGALFRGRSTSGSAPGLNAEAELESYGVGLYGGMALGDNVTASLLGLYERGDNAVTIDGDSGRDRSDHLSLSANVRGYWKLGQWWLAPSASLSWNHVEAQDFVDSGGDAVAPGVTETAQVTFGPQVGYVWFGDEHVKAIRPHLALTGVYSFLDSGTKTLSGGSIPGARGFYGQALAGVDVWFNNKTSMKFDATYDGIGSSDLEAWTVRGRVSIPFQ